MSVEEILATIATVSTDVTDTSAESGETETTSPDNGEGDRRVIIDERYTAYINSLDRGNSDIVRTIEKEALK